MEEPLRRPSEFVNREIREALRPFLVRDDWLFHYPVYLNTFCFTYDLAALLSGDTNPGRDALGGNFLRHDWSRARGLPKFTYQRDIEIFTAVRQMMEEARNDGHDTSHYVRFTRYDIRRVFVRYRKEKKERRCWLVTDLPQNAEELKRKWEDEPPEGELAKFKESKVRLSFERELYDLFADDDKLYVFGAPMAYVLMQQSCKYPELPANTEPPPKYIELPAPLNPVDTFFVFRCNSGTDSRRVRKLETAVRMYYSLIFGAPATFLHPYVAWEYGRIASTIGQPHPFHEVHTPWKDLVKSSALVSGRHGGATSILNGIRKKMNQRYASILLDHHRV